MQAYLALQVNDLDRARALAATATRAGDDADPKLPIRAAIIEGICDVLDTGTSSRTDMLSLLAPADDDLDETYSSGYSNLTYLDVEQRRLADATDLLGKSIPLTIERDLPICRVWQIGSRGRLKLIEGDWDDALADSDSVLSGPSAPLARTWPHVVRGLITLRRGGDASADLDDAWELACHLSEPMRLLPVAAALVEQAWLTGNRRQPPRCLQRPPRQRPQGRLGVGPRRARLSIASPRPGPHRCRRRRAVPPRARRSARRRRRHVEHARRAV